MSNKHFLRLLVKNLEKKARSIYTCMLEFTFPWEDAVDQKGDERAGRGLQ